MESGTELMGGMFAMFFWIGFYIFFALSMVTIAKKLGHDDHAWWGWVPLMNTFLLIELAGKPMYWFVFLLIPFVNIVVFAMLWIEVAKKRGMSAFLGFLCLVPVINFISMGMIAWGGGSNPNRVPAGSPATGAPVQPTQPTSTPHIG